MPDKRLSSLHLTIEYAVAQTMRRQKHLQDKDIEWVFEQYRNYFLALRQGKMVAEPDSTRRDRSELMDYLWECLIKWEEAGGPDNLLDGSFRPAGRAITQVEGLYVIGFNNLRKSCRLHRRESGPRGYVKHVQEWVAEVLAQDPKLEELLDPAVPMLRSTLDFQLLLDKHGYQISLHHVGTGIPGIDDFIFDDDKDEESSVTEILGLLKQYPGNPFLRNELASALAREDRKEEAVETWKALIDKYPDHPLYISAYLDMALSFDNDLGFEEAERLDFKFELNKYPFDNEDGYSVVALLRHTSACIQMALTGKDMPYAIELFNDLASTGLPKELLTSHGGHFLLALFETVETDHEFSAEDVLNEYPQFPLATALIGGMLEELAASLDLADGGNYPTVRNQLYPWPRDPGSVDRALQLRVHIIGSDPEIFRTIVVPDDTLLPDLHGMLQVAFDWEESHLHEFIQGDTHYGSRNAEAPEYEVDYRTVRVGHLLKNVSDVMVYHYDFGDGWKHHIVLEAIPEVDDEILYPRCLDGARRGPVEDSGGIHHYQHILKILENPAHPEHEEFREWLPEKFDPAEFVLAWTHRQLWKGRFWHLGADE